MSEIKFLFREKENAVDFASGSKFPKMGSRGERTPRFRSRIARGWQACLLSLDLKCTLFYRRVRSFTPFLPSCQSLP